MKKLKKSKVKFFHPAIIPFSDEGCFAPSGRCFPAHARMKQSRTEFMRKHRVVLGWLGTEVSEPRAFVVVMCRVLGKLRVHFMDAVTGTFYEARHGECLTSKKEKLVKVSIKPVDVEQASEILFAVKPVEGSGGVW